MNKLTPLEAYQLRENYNAFIQNSENPEPVKEKVDTELLESLNFINNKNKIKNEIGKFKSTVKDVFLFEALYTTLDKSIAGSSHVFIKPLMKAMVKNYITESGGSACVLSKMENKTLFLSEMARIVEKYTSIVCEDADNTVDANELTIPDNIKSSFYDELDKTEIDDVTTEIRSRVSSAVSNFIDQNAKNKEEIENIVNQANDLKANALNQQDIENEISESMLESYNNAANKKINNVINKNKTVLSHFVEAISIATMKDEQLLRESSTNGKIDFDKVMDKAGTMYTMLEMLNTTKLEKVDGEYIKNIIEDL